MCGLQGFKGDSAGVQIVLSSVMTRLHDYNQRPLYMDAKDVAFALFGLKSMNDDDQLVREIISALIPFVRIGMTEYRGQDIAMAFQGLSGMRSNAASPMVVEMVDALAVKLHECKDEMTEQQMAQILSGLQGLDSRSPEVQLVLSILASRTPQGSAPTDGPVTAPLQVSGQGGPTGHL